MKKILFICCLMIFKEIAVSQEQGDSYYKNQKISEKSVRAFFLEPLMFLSKEDSTLKISNPTLVNNDSGLVTNGYGIGLRTGSLIYNLVIIGIDGRYSQIKSGDSYYKEAETNAINLAPVIGIQTRFSGLRLLAEFIILGENDPGTGTEGVDLKFKEATGLRLIAGVVLNNISLNLEYQNLNYQSTEIQSSGYIPISKSTEIKANTKGYAVSVSFPYQF